MGSSLILVGYSAAPIAGLADASGRSTVACSGQLGWGVVARDVSGTWAGPCRSRRRGHQAGPAVGNAGGACRRVYGGGGSQRLCLPAHARLVCLYRAEEESAWARDAASSGRGSGVRAPSLRGWKNILPDQVGTGWAAPCDNTRMLRWTTAGESHGQALISLLEHMPAGVPITRADISHQLSRRRLGYGRGARMKFEADEVTLLGGVRHGLTLGSPIAIMIGNAEWPKWTTIMSADPLDMDDEDNIKAMNSGRGAALTRPRPGHADFAGMVKYRHGEARPILERSSARETAARVAAATVARNFLRETLGIEVLSHVISIGAAAPYEGPAPAFADIAAIDDSPVRAFDKDAETAMIAEIEAAKKQGDTLGGVVEVVVDGLPIGLGSHISGDDRLDAQLAGALMGIQAIKGVEIGDGFAEARRRGSAAHDEMVRTADGVSRLTNRAGGLEGGMTNGQQLRVRAAMKPISTVPRALRTIDMESGADATAIHQRSDVCAVPAAGVVAEAMVALVLARAVLEKFGGDSLEETSQAIAAYDEYVSDRLAFDQE